MPVSAICCYLQTSVYCRYHEDARNVLCDVVCRHRYSFRGCGHRFECVLHDGPRHAHVEAHPALAGPPGGRTVVQNHTGLLQKELLRAHTFGQAGHQRVRIEERQVRALRLDVVEFRKFSRCEVGNEIASPFEVAKGVGQLFAAFAVGGDVRNDIRGRGYCCRR